MEIAIIAHDGKKEEMVKFLKEYKDFFQQDHIQLIATGTTGAANQRLRAMLSRF